MKMIFIPLLLLIGCATQKKSNEIKQFIRDYSAQYQSNAPENKLYLSGYEEYLKSVSSIFEETDQSDKFDDYLDKLRENGSIIVDTQKDLVNKRSLYKTKVLTNLSDVLNDKRIQELKRELNQNTFAKLLENNQRFNQAGRSEGIFFPL